MKRKTASWVSGLLGFLTMITGGLLWWRSDSTIKVTISTPPPPPPVFTVSPPTRPDIPSNIVGRPMLVMVPIWCTTEQALVDWYNKAVEQGVISSKEVHQFIVPSGVEPRRQTSEGTPSYQKWQADLWETYLFALAKLEQEPSP